MTTWLLRYTHVRMFSPSNSTVPADGSTMRNSAWKSDDLLEGCITRQATMLVRISSGGDANTRQALYAPRASSTDDADLLASSDVESDARDDGRQVRPATNRMHTSDKQHNAHEHTHERAHTPHKNQRHHSTPRTGTSSPAPSSRSCRAQASSVDTDAATRTARDNSSRMHQFTKRWARAHVASQRRTAGGRRFSMTCAASCGSFMYSTTRSTELNEFSASVLKRTIKFN
jgi:hypothetical protein